MSAGPTPPAPRPGTAAVRRPWLTHKRLVRIIRVGLAVAVVYCVVYMIVRYDYMSLNEQDISMAPTISGGQRILVDTWAGGDDPFEVGQIVLYRANVGGRAVLRMGRIEAGPGDVLEERENSLWVGDRDLQAAPENLQLGSPIPDRRYIILVENPGLRRVPDLGYPDSRHVDVGAVSEEQLVGRYMIHF